MYDVYSCGFDGVGVRPKRVHKQNIFIFAKDFAFKKSHELAKKINSRVSRGTLGSVWVSVGDFGSLDGHFTIIVGLLWVYKGPFSKNIHFPYRF